MSQEDRKYVVLLTGASRGLGQATIYQLASLKRVTHFSLVARDASKLEKIKNDIEKLDKDIKVITIVADLADPSAPEKIINETISHFGQIDTLFGNAGISIKNPISKIKFGEKYEDSDLFQTLQINLMSNIQLAHYALPHIRKTKGRMVFISSGAGVLARPANGLYAASKAGLNIFTGCLALEEPDISVIAVNPGPTNTDMFQETLRYEREHTNMKVNQSMKMNDPKDVAKSFSLLALCIPRECSGQYIQWNDERVLKLLPEFGL